MIKIVVTKKPPEYLDKFLKQNKEDEVPSKSNQMFFTAYDEDTILGVLISKSITINKRHFLKIETLVSHDQLITSGLLGYLYSTANEAYVFGILSTPIRTANEHIYKALAKDGYRIDDQIFITTPSQLTSKSKSDLSAIRFSSRNRSLYRSLFSQLLIEHDTHNNRLKNTTYNKQLFQTNLKKSRTHNIRISYFVAGVLKSSNWYVQLYFIDEDTPIGFIKGQLSPHSNSITPDIYIRPKYFDKYIKSCLDHFSHNLPKQITELNIVVNQSDKDLKGVINQIVKPKFTSFFKIL